jgi:L-threonylcarbamoyladenylate synthase
MPTLTPDLRAAIQHLREGAVVAFPTETVYGLGADARNPLAVRRIFATKGRPVDHPVIVHLPDRDALERWARVPDRWRDAVDALADHHWPGPLTFILPRQPTVLDEVTGGRDTVGIRIPSHPVAQALLAGFGGALAAPSANRFGHISPTTAAHVRAEFPDLLVLDGGASPVGIESTIVDLSGEHATLLRPGAVTRGELEPVLGPLAQGSTPAPGTLASHYAPHTALLLTDDMEGEAARLRSAGRTVALIHAGDDPADHARRLYAELRRLDAAGVDFLLAERAQGGGIGEAINDRLTRAARGRDGSS